MTPGDAADPHLKRFLVEWLELGDDDGDHARLLRRLRDEDFLPDPVRHDAIRAVCGLPLGAASLLAEEAARVEESRLRDEVERFADDYFAIPPAERRLRLRSLAVACKAHAGLIDRLRHLSRGLDLDRGAMRDGSPLVERLAGHACTLFLLRPGPRAVAGRALVRELRGDETIRDAELRRALKRLAKRQRPVAMLAQEFLNRLAQPRQPKGLRQLRTRFAVSLNSNMDDRPLTYIGIMAAFVTSLVIYASIMRDPNGPRPSPRSIFAEDHTVPPPPVLTIVTKRKASAKFLRSFRDQFKAPIRSELEKLDKPIDEPDLQRVVDALPADGVPEAGMATLRLLGYWSEEVHDLYASTLRKELALSGITLSDAEFARVVRGCFPSPVEGPRRAPGPPGGVLRLPRLEKP